MADITTTAALPPEGASMSATETVPSPPQETEKPAPTEESGPDLSWLPPGKKPLADGLYDAIVMGTGLKASVGTEVAGWKEGMG